MQMAAMQIAVMRMIKHTSHSKKSDELDGGAPEAIYGSDGEEMLCETEYGCKLMSGS